MSLSLGLGLALTRNKGGFSLPAFMAAQAGGFWFDFADTDTLFQEPNGPTSANDPNEVIGLALSQRSWGGRGLAAYLAGRPELRGIGAPALSGTATAATYNTSTGVGSASRVDAANQSAVGFAVAAGRTYEIDLEITSAAMIRSGAALGGSAASVFLSGSARQKCYVTASSAFIFVAATVNATTASFIIYGLKDVTDQTATQGTATLKPKYQATGAAFDGSDDNLLTTYLPGATANFMVAVVTVPASIPALQVIAGSSISGQRFWMAIDTLGRLCGGVGANSANVIVSTDDLRGQTVAVGISCDGTTVKLFAASAEVYSGAQSGSSATGVACALGAVNFNGTINTFFAGSIKAIVAGQQALDLPTFKKIASKL